MSDGTSLLKQLDECVGRILRATGSEEDGEATNATLDAGDQLTGQLVKLLERVFQHQTKGKRKGSWWFFEAAFDAQSPVLRYVSACMDTKTPEGKARCFFRYCLQNRTLAEHIQMAMHKPAVVQEHFHRDSIARDERLSFSLLDNLYHLNDVSFSIEGNPSMDNGWYWTDVSPSLAAPSSAKSSPAKSPRSELSIKSFSPKQSRSNLNKKFARTSSSSNVVEDDKTSLASLASLSASLNTSLVASANSSLAPSAAQSADTMVSGHEELEEIRAERDAIEREHAALIKEKRDADAAWNQRVSSLKTKLLQMTEVTEKLERELTAQTERANKLEAVVAAHKQQLREAETTLAELQEGNAESTEKDEEEQDQSSEALQQQMQDAFDRYIEAEKRSRRLEEQLEQRSKEHQAELSELQSTLNARDQLCAELEQSARHRQQQHDALQSRAQTQQATIQNQTEDIAVLRKELNAATDSISDLTAALQAAETSRTQDAERISVMQQALDEERARADAAEQLCETSRQALEKMADDKLALWNQFESQNDTIRRLRQQDSAVWQPDSAARNCSKCTSEFSVFNRRHHCRQCGKIFCHQCCDNWFQRASSSKQERVCDGCEERILAARTSRDTDYGGNSTIVIQERERSMSQGSIGSAGLLSVSQSGGSNGRTPPRSPLSRREDQQ